MKFPHSNSKQIYETNIEFNAFRRYNKINVFHDFGVPTLPNGNEHATQREYTTTVFTRLIEIKVTNIVK